jgi:CDP-paratose 2-epimerase
VPTAIVTGSGGLVGSEAAAHLVRKGFDVLGVDNDSRALFFGPDASTAQTTVRLAGTLGSSFRAVDLDVRDREGIERLVSTHAGSLELIVHAAAQPSHDWAARDPHTDFAVNATGTLNLLEAVHQWQPAATFAFMSTNKVYGDHPNRLPLIDAGDRLELPEDHPSYGGIGTDMPLDDCMHSLFGVSKTAADLMVQEYGRYFDMPTVCLRAGCLTGPAHAGAELHGFLSYLMRCVVEGRPYVIHGHGGKQVRDNLHAHDVARAIEAFHAAPRPAAVYNLGGGRECSCSVLEAIALSERIAGRALDWSLSDQARAGDHRWWISDLDPFIADHPDWSVTYDLERTLTEIHAAYADAPALRT